MTVIEIPQEGYMRVRMGATTEHRGYVDLGADPVPTGNVEIIVDEARVTPTDDEFMRSYVSRLWAEDWDSPEDAVYDTW